MFKAENRDDLNYFINEINTYRDTIKHLDSMSFFFLKLYLALFSFIFLFASYLFTNKEAILQYKQVFSIIGITTILITVLVGYSIMRLLSHLSKKRNLNLRHIVKLREFVDVNFHKNALKNISVLPINEKNITLKHFEGMPRIFNLLNIIIPIGTFFYLNIIFEDTYVSILIALSFSFIALIALSNTCELHVKEYLIGCNASNSFTEKELRKLFQEEKNKLKEKFKNFERLFISMYISCFLTFLMCAIFYFINNGIIPISFTAITITSFSFALIFRFLFLKKYLKELEEKTLFSIRRQKNKKDSIIYKKVALKT